LRVRFENVGDETITIVLPGCATPSYLRWDIIDETTGLRVPMQSGCDYPMPTLPGAVIWLKPGVGLDWAVLLDPRQLWYRSDTYTVQITYVNDPSSDWMKLSPSHYTPEEQAAAFRFNAESILEEAR